MRSFLPIVAVLLVAAGLTVAVAVAGAPAAQQTPSTGMPMSGQMGTMMTARRSSSAALKLTIVHVQRGCHVWSNGKTTATTMQLHMKRGQQLMIRDMDVDAHQMMQFGGPMHLRMGGPMMMNGVMTLSFPKAGVYHVGTRTVEMPGGMDVKTIGPDNTLRLVVTVA